MSRTQQHKRKHGAGPAILTMKSITHNELMTMTEEYYKEEERYVSIYTTLLLSGEYREQDIDAQVHEIMDNPNIYPEYFN